MYALLVIKLHYPPEYVLDKMEWYEINAALQYQYYSYKENWEQARLIAYMIAQVNSKKHLKLEEIIKFPWDNEKEMSIADTKITKEDIERLNKKAEAYKQLNQKAEVKKTII